MGLRIDVEGVVKPSNCHKIACFVPNNNPDRKMLRLLSHKTKKSRSEIVIAAVEVAPAAGLQVEAR